MKDIYYIDNESIKRTAKAIQKTLPNKKYTEILNDISSILGYSSYNQYEHYLTNSILSQNTNLNRLKALTKIDTLRLHMLERKFVNNLKLLGYEIDSLYFIQNILIKQKEAINNYHHLNIKDYVYYLPFMFDDLNSLTSDYFSYKKDIKPYINNLVIFYKNTLGLDFINTLISKAKVINIDATFENDLDFEQLKTGKTRGLYYYLKSIAEDIEYEEGLLTDMIFKDYSLERIEFELNKLVEKVDQDITIFFKENNIVNDSYYTNIRNNTSQSNPIMFGMRPDNTPYFPTSSMLRNNILLAGRPGDGKSLFIRSFLYQAVMNNRGFAIFSPTGKPYLTDYIEHISKSLNKGQDIFNYCHNSNLRSVPNAVNNDKILIINSLQNGDLRRGIDYMQKSQLQFKDLLRHLTEYFYNSKFKEKLIPFYIFIEESYILEDLDFEMFKMIKKLNSISIFFIFDIQLISEKLCEISNLILVANSSLSFYKNSSSFELNQIFKEILNDKNLIGTGGPTLKNPTVFSVIQDSKYNGQFISEIDNELVNMGF